MSNHTKGHWRQESYRLFANQTARPEYPIHAPKRGLIAKAFRKEDARLIAAAPELLEALKDLVDNGIGTESVKHARAVIAKATGANA